MSIGFSPKVSSSLAQHRATIASPASSPWKYHIAAIVVLVAMAALRLLYLNSQIEISLASDEAHYWDWSRHLDWCYYSKGPLVAWLIRASCYVWGADVMPAVRLPAVLCNALTMLGIYLLIYRIFRDARVAFFSLLAAHTLPLLNVGGLMMTIDAPYTCAWTWAVLLAHCALFPRTGATSQKSEAKTSSPFSWLLTPDFYLWFLMGIVVAIGVLAKHNMALFVPSLGLFLLLSPEHRSILKQPGFWVMALTGAIVGGGPILLWNAQHNWVTFLHVGTQATGQSTGLRWLGPLEFIGTQAGLLLGFWFLLMTIGCYQVVKNYLQRNILPQQLFLVCLALPMMLICMVFSFKVRIEPNWPVTAYITGLVLAGWMLWERWHIRIWRRTAIGFLIFGGIFSLFMHGTDVVYPLTAKLIPDVAPRRWDPTCRLKGWHTLAEEVDKLRSAEPQSPILFGSTWSNTGALAFHLKDQPTVYCLGPVAGSRHSQYDFWLPNPLANPDQFTGRDAIIVGDITPQIRAAFESLEPTKLITAKQHGLMVAQWNVTIARKLKPTGFGDGIKRY